MLRDLSWLKRVKLLDKDGNLIDNDNPLPVLYRFFYKINWTSDTDFGKGSLTNTEIKDTEDDAYIQLEENEDNSDDIPFTTPSNYIYDSNYIEFVGGKAQLKKNITESINWDFSTPADYVYDTNKIEVTGGIAKLKGSPLNPYAWYHLNSSSGSTAIDSSGNERNGTLVNMEDSDWVAGKLNNCLRINNGSSNEYVNCGNIAGFERDEEFSYEFWIKGTNTTNFQTILSKTPYGAWHGLELFIVSGKLQIYLIGAGEQIYRYGTANITSGNWHHCVITYDGSSTYEGITIYVDNNDVTGSGSGTLSTSIVNGSDFQISGRGGAYNCLLGYDVDEVVIYTKELTPAEIALRYNSGNGTESMVGGYPLTNPTIYPSSGFAFTSEITGFTETTTKPTDTEIKYHVSSDDGVTWKYWNGSAWVVTDNSYTQANLASEIHSYINELAFSGTFKFRALLHTDSELRTPELDNLYIVVATYSLGGKEIEMNWDIQPTQVIDYLTVAETVIEPEDTDVKYKYSIDSGSTYNDSWLTASELQTALQGISCVGDGTDTIRFKFQLLTTNTIKTPQIDNLNLVSDAGYQRTGEFESNIYNSSYYSLDWGIIEWEVIIPSGCTIVIKAKASNDSGDLGSYSSALSNGEDLTITGRYIQWKIEFTGNGRYTPKLNDLHINYAYPLRTEFRP